MAVTAKYKILVGLADNRKIYLGEHTHFIKDDVWSWMDKVVRKHVDVADHDKIIHTRGHKEGLAGYAEITDAESFHKISCPEVE